MDNERLYVCVCFLSFSLMRTHRLDSGGGREHGNERQREACSKSGHSESDRLQEAVKVSFLFLFFFRECILSLSLSRASSTSSIEFRARDYLTCEVSFLLASSRAYCLDISPRHLARRRWVHFVLADVSGSRASTSSPKAVTLLGLLAFYNISLSDSHV